MLIFEAGFNGETRNADKPELAVLPERMPVQAEGGTLTNHRYWTKIYGR
jgi:hypothetical protein